MIMSREELSSAIKYPGDKSKVLSLLPIVKDPAGIKGNKERTLLHCAARNGWIDVCRLLVEQYQVDPHCKTSGGRTALHCAAIRGWTDLCRLLVEQYQVDPHCRDNDRGYTALHWAANNGWPDVCRLLVEQYRVNPHCRDNSGWTALHRACHYDQLDVVQYLVSSVCCDPLSSNDQRRSPFYYTKGKTRLFLQRIIESSEKAGYTNVVDYLKHSIAAELVIAEAVAEAMAGEGGELFQCNLVFHGPPGSGKSSTQDTILGEPPRPKHKQNATNILEKSVRTVCIAAITDDNQLVQVSNSDMIGRLAGEVDILLEDNKPDDQHLSKSDNPSSSINTTGESLAVSLEETSNSTSAAKVSSSSDEAIQDPSKYRPLNTKTEKLIKQRLLDPRKRHRSRRVFDCRWLHHIDSGGQPQYLDTFPMMHRSPAHFVVVMNVTEGLDERPKVRFYNQGKDEYRFPDRLVLTNREMIVRMCQIAQRIAQDTGGKFVPRVFVVGTHKDQLFPIFGRRHLKAMNSELLRIHEKHSDVLVCRVPGEQVMFTINAMAEGKERQQYTEELQKHILAATENTGVPVKVPLNWLIFHLELDKGEGVVRMSECRRLGGKMGMNEERVGLALEFLNKAALILYFPEDVPDLVLFKMDPFTSRLSRLIKASFLPPDKGPTKESEELRDKGVFKRTFLKRVFGDLKESLLSEEEFLKLLESLRIAVHIGGEEYFLPSALSLEPPPKESFFESKSIPLSLSWGELILPHGLFPTVCVELLAGREGGYVFELRRDTAQRREEIQLSEEKGRIPGVMKLSDRQRWIEVSYSGDNSYCSTVNGIVNGATQRAIARLRHVGIRSPTIGCICPLCIVKDHYCYLSEDRRSVTCSINRSKTGPVTADICCWFEVITATPPRGATQASIIPLSVSTDTTIPSTHTIADQRVLKCSPCLKDVYDLLRVRASKWEEIGIELRVGGDYRDQLRGEGIMSSDCSKLDRVLRKWAESECSPVTWDTVVGVASVLQLTESAEQFLNRPDTLDN